jgi:hypothetical protein
MEGRDRKRIKEEEKIERGTKREGGWEGGREVDR